MPENNDAGLMPKLIILLMGIGSAALVVTIYHCFAVGWCPWWIPRRSSSERLQSRSAFGDQGGQQPSYESSIVELLPVLKYNKGMKCVNDATCAVCLCDFEDGEDLRSLPECLHSFHVGCIDMWLYSHLNCPVCRADATPSPSPLIVRSRPEMLMNIRL